MVGETAEYDVFISYRVDSDAHHAEFLYDMMTQAGIKVWWDKKCLERGGELVTLDVNKSQPFYVISKHYRLTQTLSVTLTLTLPQQIY